MDEFAGAQLGDARRSARLRTIVETLGRDPRCSFPQAFATDAELWAFYRFINNDGFTAEDVMAPHQQATFARCAEEPVVVAVHDTTTVEFERGAPRRGLGRTTCQGRQGFFAHVTLLLTPEGIPLGVGQLQTWTRSGTKRRRRKVTNRVRGDDPARESLRWWRGVEQLEAHRAPRTELVHVMDAEGDFFELLAGCCSQPVRFIIRGGQFDRIVETETGLTPLRDALEPIPPRLWRDVPLCERHHRRGLPRALRRKHPERLARTAHIAIGATTLQLRKSKYSGLSTAPFPVNVVRVWEPQPPPDQPPLEWVLLTSEPIATASDLERVVDFYRLRWVIEEFFKALKSCSLEKRQLESYDALRKTLVLFLPIACRLLLLRTLERLAPEADARCLLSAVELSLLQHAPSNRALPPPRTVRDALLHLARLGGHLRHNGPPGWLTLSRGYDKLLLLRLGYLLGQPSPKCVQS